MIRADFNDNEKDEIMIRIAVIEDEERDYFLIKEYLERYSKEKNVNFVIEHFPDAVNFVSDYHYNFDLIFLDIMMPGIDGMNASERLRKIDRNVELIFVTRMEQYAIQGYNVSARYFIVKPIGYVDFANKLDNTLPYVKHMIRSESIMLNLPFDEIRKIFVKDIKYIEVFDHDVVIHLFTEEIRMRGRLSDFEKQLSPEKFCRVNSCYIVNLNCVRAVKDKSVFLGDVELRVSHARKKALIKALSDYIAREE